MSCKCSLPCGDGPNSHHVFGIMGLIFSEICRIMGPHFQPKPRPLAKLGLVTPPPPPGRDHSSIFSPPLCSNHIPNYRVTSLVFNEDEQKLPCSEVLSLRSMKHSNVFRTPDNVPGFYCFTELAISLISFMLIR